MFQMQFLTDFQQKTFDLVAGLHSRDGHGFPFNMLMLMFSCKWSHDNGHDLHTTWHNAPPFHVQEYARVLAVLLSRLGCWMWKFVGCAWIYMNVLGTQGPFIWNTAASFQKLIGVVRWLNWCILSLICGMRSGNTWDAFGEAWWLKLQLFDISPE